MRLDRTHRSWMFAALGIFAVSLGTYIPYSMASRPRGGSVLGIVYGVLGYGMMLFAALLGVRKRLPVWRLGRAQTWMRGHIWLGLLTLPMILFHAGFTFRGPLTGLLMALLILVFLSGVTGAAIQHFVPRMMTASVPLETIYEQIPHVRDQLRQEADKLVRVLFTQTETVHEAASEEMIEMEVEERQSVAKLYNDMILPFLRDPESTRSPLADADGARSFFETLRRKLPASTHAVIADLENLCEEERQLIRQRRLYVLLHGWLVVHVPLSIALTVLGAVHAVVALRY
jgi:hypothetical protein